MSKLIFKYLFVYILLIFPALLYVGGFYVSLFKNPKNLAQTDFVPYLTGAVMLQKHNINYLYQPSIFKNFQEALVSPLPTHHLVYRALPFATLLYYPFTFFNFKISYFIFSTLSLISLVLINIIISKIFPKFTTIPFWPLIIFVIYPTFYSIGYGQTSLITTLFLIICYIFTLRRQYFYAGLFLSLLLIKPHFFVVFSIFLVIIIPKLSLLKGLFSGTALTLTLCYLTSNTFKLSNFIQYILNTESQNFGSRITSYQNLSSFFPPYITIVIFLTVLTIIRLKSLPLLQKLSAITLFAPLFAFHTPLYELTAYIFPLAFLIQKKKTIPAIILFIVLLLPNILNTTFISVPIFFLLGIYLLKSKV